MKLDLVRKIYTVESTIGELSVDGDHECLTLEDTVRDTKIPDMTAVPSGTYRIVLRRSPRFGRTMPALQQVPGYNGILIHWGNTAKDTSGCILVGESQSKNFIGSSRLAFDHLFARLEAAASRGEPLTITIG